MTSDSREQLLEAARAEYCLGSDDNIEIDPDAKLSVGEDGIWVQAWVFMRNEELPDGVRGNIEEEDA